MAETEIELTHGLKIGDAVYKTAIVREATAGDFLECQELSEKVVFVSDGSSNKTEPVFVSSPSLMTSLLLCRQVKSIDDHQGPLELDELKSLHPEDLSRLMDATESLLTTETKSLSNEVSTMGRSDSGGES